MDCRVEPGNDATENPSRGANSARVGPLFLPSAKPRGAERRKAHRTVCHAGEGMAAHLFQMRPPSGAPLGGSNRWAFRPAGAAPGHVSWDEAGRPILYGRPNRGAQTSRSAVHDPEKPAHGLDPGVVAGFPARSCTTRRRYPRPPIPV